MLQNQTQNLPEALLNIHLIQGGGEPKILEYQELLKHRKKRKEKTAIS